MNKPRTILWVDDDNDLLKHNRSNLLDAGYAVDVESNVDVAIEKMKDDAEKLKGVILDVMMNPGVTLRNHDHQGGLKTGLVLLTHIRREKILDGVSIFFFSHRVDGDAVEKAETMGVRYHQKQDYKGKKICDLVFEEFGKP